MKFCRTVPGCLLIAAALVGGCSQTLHQGEHGEVRVAPDGTLRVTGVCSFEGVEDPTMKWVVADNRAEHDDFVNIADVAPGVVRMTLRYRGDWWDGDQSTSRKDRQRAEVKGVGPRQKEGETFEYATTWRTDANFTDSAFETTTAYADPIQKHRRHFCHVFQLKATNGDDGAPLVTMSVEEGNRVATVDYWSGNAEEPTVIRSFAWKPGEWHRVKIRIRTAHEDGEVMASVDGDAFHGVMHVPVFRPESTEYRPKWGLYRAAGPGSGLHDDWVEHKDVTARKLGN